MGIERFNVITRGVGIFEKLAIPQRLAKFDRVVKYLTDQYPISSAFSLSCVEYYFNVGNTPGEFWSIFFLSRLNEKCPECAGDSRIESAKRDVINIDADKGSCDGKGLGKEY